MSKKYNPPEYEIGAYITGIDRSYERSIYKYHGMNKWNTKIGMELLAFANKTYLESEVEYFNAKVASDYRVATREELIDSGVFSKSIDFILED